MKDDKNLIRINKFIALCNICSRRQAEDLIKQSRVKVNGKIQNDLSYIVDVRTDSIEVDGKVIELKNKNIYIMINKPKNYIVTKKDEYNRKNIFSLIPDFGSNMLAIGRLDSQTEGMLILTDNGDFAQEIIHPKNKIPKTYKVVCKGFISDNSVDILRKGVEINGKMTLPCKVFVKERKDNRTVLRMTIYEGRNRQIRRMIEAIGSSVNELKRLQIGRLKMSKLPIGMWRFLNSRDLALLLERK